MTFRLFFSMCLLTSLVQWRALAADGELFDLPLDELMRVKVSVASRVGLADDVQPASVTTITRRDIQLSGARQLSAVLQLYVPGFFLTEDQDDIIAGFRGLSPDNNSKVMLLIDGVKQNTEWFWGPSDAVLHGFDLDYIERIDVIRGPGAIVQGHGALMGVINIITRRLAHDGDTEVLAQLGENGYRTASMQARQPLGSWTGDLHASLGEFGGVPVPREGWAADRFEQGLFVADRGHHVQRGDYSTVAFNLRRDSLTVDASRRQQRRDLYNFYRDREEVEQTLTQLALRQNLGLSDGARFNWSLHTVLDDYDLYTHEGEAVGGTQERRHTASWDWSRQVGEPLEIVVGGEWVYYQIGRVNENGRNYLVNAVADRDGNDDVSHRYVNAESFGVGSLYVDSIYALSETIKVFAGWRLDKHPEWGRESSPRLAMLYTPDGQQYFRLSWQRGFRGAVGVHYAGGFVGDGLLSSGNFTSVENNANLAALGFSNLPETEPETITTRELAWEWRNDQHWSADVVLFDNEVHNVIDVGVYYVDPNIQDIRNEFIGTDRAGSWNGFFFFKNNAGAITWRGAEARVGYAGDGWNLAISYAQVGVRSASVDNLNSMYIAGTTGDLHVKSYPEQVWRANLRWLANDAWSIALNVVYYPEWRSPSSRKQPGGRYLTGVVSWQANDANEIQLSLQNLLDEDALYPLNNNVGDAALGEGTPTYQPRSAWLAWRLRF